MLKGWPFSQDETVQLLWIKSPYRDVNKEWMMPLVLQSKSGVIKQMNVPWGLLPYFRLGQYYIDGVPIELCNEGTLEDMEFFKIDFSEPSAYHLKVKDLPDGFDIKDIADIKEEYVWVSYSDDYIIYIPCIEIIRSFLAPNAILARALLEPNGLDFLATSAVYKKDTLSLNLSSQIPRIIISDSLVFHLGWLLSSPTARKSWNSILPEISPYGDIDQSVLFFDEQEMSVAGPKKIKAFPPIDFYSTWRARSLKRGREYLFLEIVSVNNLKLPYDKIIFSYHSLSKKKTIGVNNGNLGISRVIRKKKRKEKSVVINNPTSISKAVKIGISNNILSFEKLPELEKQYIERRVNRERHPRNNRQLSKRELREREILARKAKNDESKDSNIEILSGSEVIFTGRSEVKPIEYRGPSITTIPVMGGLEKFRLVLEVLEKMDKRISISDYKLDFLPYGRSFSSNEDGSPRKFALATVKTDYKTKYILEVERQKNLSTLIIESRKKEILEDAELYREIGDLLYGLLKNYGNWNKNQLIHHPTLKIEKVKHLEEWTVNYWAMVIYERLNML